MSANITDREPIPDLPPPIRRKRLREHFGVTQDEIAAEIGVTTRTIRRWESDSNPTGQVRIAYAAILKTWQDKLSRKD
jgi:DNA-binding XRE family transcriptional regulator